MPVTARRERGREGPQRSCRQVAHLLFLSPSPLTRSLSCVAFALGMHRPVAISLGHPTRMGLNHDWPTIPRGAANREGNRGGDGEERGERGEGRG